jgi:GNAT superfamily N-acetyltransferase
MKCKKADAQDVDMIAPLFDRYRQFYGQSSDLAGAREFIKARLSENESHIFLAHTDSAKSIGSGFVQLYPSFSSVSMKRLWILNDLFVSDEFRGKGVAKALMQQAENFARETGAKGLTLKTAIDNLEAQNLYISMGWKQDKKFLTFDLKTTL